MIGLMSRFEDKRHNQANIISSFENLTLQDTINKTWFELLIQICLLEIA